MGTRTRWVRRALVLLLSAVLASAGGWWVVGLLGRRDAVHALSPWMADRSAPCGFRAHWTVPAPPGADLACVVGWGPSSMRWTSGPDEGFGAIGASELARRSLAWFESSPEAEAWSGEDAPTLEFVYPSAEGLVSLSHVDGTVVDWSRHITSWFERFPPIEAPALADDARYTWTIRCDGGDALSNRALSAAAAVASLRRLSNEHAPFRSASFELVLYERRGPRQVDVFSAEAERVEDLSDMPWLLEQQREDARSLFGPAVREPEQD